MSVDLHELYGFLPLIHDFVAGADIETFELRVRYGSPWIEFDVWVHMALKWEFALWKSKGAVYLVGADGAVGEDPVESLQEVINQHTLPGGADEHV